MMPPLNDVQAKAALPLSDLWIDQASIEDLYRFLTLLSLKLIDATVKDIGSNDEKRQRFGYRFLAIDNDFDAACIIAGLKPNCTREKVRARAMILRERNERRNRSNRK